MKKFKNYFQAVQYIDSIRNFPAKHGSANVRDRRCNIPRLAYLLKLLNNPHHHLKCIQVTGTGGKGTVANYLHEILTAGGFKVGSFLSPHVSAEIERIKINGQYIAPDQFSETLDQLKPYLNICVEKSPYGHPSFFETLLAMAFLYFKKEKVDYAVLEAGLGGQNDATNIVKENKLALITNIDYDHTEVLGNSLTKIALDKAGIIKKGSCFITTETRPKMLKIFQERCQKVKASFLQIKADELERNQALARAAAQHFKIAEKQIIKGFKNSKLPCRFEIIQKSPLVIVDGSHNRIKLKYLEDKLENLNFRKLHIILALAYEKDARAALKEILPLADKLWLTRTLLTYRKSSDLKELYQIGKKFKKNLEIKIIADPWQSLKLALREVKKHDCLLITGSFYLAGELRKHWISEEYTLKHRKSF